MIRIKTLSLPLISALVASTVAPATAQVAFELSSQKTYRQKGKSVNFTGGRFDAKLSDGNVVSVGGCDWQQYYPPGYFLGICSQGTTALLTSGSIAGGTRRFPYLLVTGLQPAIGVEPRVPDYVKLTAAPASGLPRPQGGFKDSSASLFYNLHTAAVQEYVFTRYSSAMTFDKGEREKFDKYIVPGVYHYSFPRLGYPTIPAPIVAQIYSMPEGLAEKNNKTAGFQFTSINQNKWTKDGFMELSYIRPNTFNWRPFSPVNTFVSSDLLSFSIRVMSNPNNPNSATDLLDDYTGAAQAIFPDYTNDGDPKVYLPNPFTSSFVTPPVLPGGTKGIAEIQLQRNLQTGGVTYDFSTRKFQIPVTVVNRYSEFQDLSFFGAKSKSSILDDADGDGYNNLNEWILDSSPTDKTSTPTAPVPAEVDAQYNLGDFYYFYYYGNYRLIRNQYYGFTFNEKLGTNPAVAYTLQRSHNKGKTWENFKNGYYFSDGTYSKTYTPDQINRKPLDWIVKTVTLAPGVGSLKENSPKRVEIRVESGYPYSDLELGGDGTQTQPPGTENDIYRIKVTLKK